jgi:hypothetical protein
MGNVHILNCAIVMILRKIMGNVHNMNCAIVSTLRRIMGNVHNLTVLSSGPYIK